LASEAAKLVSKQYSRGDVDYIPMPLGSLSARVLLLLTEPDFDDCSPTIVDVDDERLKVLASGARCVSLSFLVSFQDIVGSEGGVSCVVGV
jgi:hypothetical protein